MKITLDIEDDLLAEANAFTQSQHLTLECLVEEGLRMRLLAKGALAVRHRAMPVFSDGKGLAPGLSGLSTREMLDEI